MKMTKYLQTNEAGYIVGLVDEPLLLGLFGGSPKNYRQVNDEEAKVIETVLRINHSSGKGLLHIDNIVTRLKAK